MRFSVGRTSDLLKDRVTRVNEEPGKICCQHILPGSLIIAARELLMLAVPPVVVVAEAYLRVV